jgi:creatinine amidohydrolase
MDNTLSTDVQMQCMRPTQLEAAGRAFPVAYVPFGPIEWHGRHLPVGNDTMKAHAVLVKTAEQSGGIVHPPVYFHDRFNQDYMRPVVTELFDRLKTMGFRVIIGVSGHNVEGMLEMIDAALEPATSDGECAGIGLWEMTLSQSDDSNTDHAAKWETSNMMFLHPEFVDLDTLGTEQIAFDSSAPHGINGLDPRIHATAEVGRLNVELCSEAIGKKAQELLQSLPVEKRGFNIEKIEPDTWRML